jgi:uncharacterized protein (TIGR02217 family)
MALFHDVKLPDSVEQGAQGGPEYLTSLIAMSSGFEQRNIDWQVARQAWDISYGIDDQTTFDVVRQFFYARRGKAYAFRFRDWSDYQLNLELLGLGDGVKTDFQLTKTEEAAGPLPYVRKLTRPTISTLVMSVNGVITASWTDLGLGLIRFTVAPAAAAQVRAVYCEFDVPMRFDVDKFPLIAYTQLAAEVGNLPLVEVRE